MPSTPWDVRKASHSGLQIGSVTVCLRFTIISRREGRWLRESNKDKLPLPGEEEEQRRKGCWLPWKMWVSIWWGAHWRWGPKLREGCERERRGWMLTWAWPQRAGVSHLFLNPLSLECFRPRKSPDRSRDPRALSRSGLTAFLKKLSGQRDSRPGRWKIHR